MIRKFWGDIRGNFAIATSLVLVPMLGGLALAVDYTEMSRQKALTLNALDAAGIAAARFFVQGGTEEETIAYARDFFEANMNGLDTSGAEFKVTLPTEDTGGGLLTIEAKHKYTPYFFSAFASLIGNEETDVVFEAETQIRLKNTLEVALVLDNSGSMDYDGSGSGKKRITLLKDAAKQLVDTLAAQAAQIKQVDKPVQFALVPFAASVNVGPSKSTASWMDTDGRSPIHHENFDWSTMPTNKKVQLSSGIYYKTGENWGDEEGQKVTRFTLFDEMERITSQTWDSEWVCVKYKWSGACDDWEDHGHYDYTYGSFAGWQGCVETRPHPYSLDDTPPNSANPATLYVPMFAPDEAGDRWSTSSDPYPDNYGAYTNYWNDGTEDSSASKRQKYMPKYFEIAPNGFSAAGSGKGPNESCTTKPITPLVDVTTTAGKDAIKAAIDQMAPLGATNVPEGLAWGWKTLSHHAPFTEGRAESEKGNDKVVIVLTDGANTYYTPGSLGANDYADNKSIYSAYGYTGKIQSGGSYTRLFMGTSSSVNKSSYANDNYTVAMTEHMSEMCEKAKTEGLMLMTVSLDLSTSNSTEKKQIDALKACSSESRFSKDPSDPTKAKKLFWNTTGGDLEKTFKEIADELSNLRIVG